MADDNAFRTALNDFLYRLHVGANSGNSRQVDAWRQMGYDIPVMEITGSAISKPAEVKEVETAVIEEAMAETPELKAETLADPSAEVVEQVRKSMIANAQPRPTQSWEGESTAQADPKVIAKAYEYLVRSTQAQSTNKKVG